MPPEHELQRLATEMGVPVDQVRAMGQVVLKEAEQREEEARGMHVVRAPMIPPSAPQATPPPSARLVEAVNPNSLAAILDSHAEDVLVVFYAPWCGTCQGFVLGSGNPADAPIEHLNQQLFIAHGPRVVKWDIQANGHPSMFNVQYVPDIHLATRAGLKTATTCNAHDVGCLKTFALAGVSAGQSPAALLGLPSVPAWSCPLTKLAGGPTQSHRGTLRLHAHDKSGASAGPQQVESYTGDMLSAAMADRDMLVVFFAPWCPHCQTLVMASADAPLEQLNRRFIVLKGPQVVKFDVEESETPPEFHVVSIPTAFLVRRGASAPIKFEGDPHDLDLLTAFSTTAPRVWGQKATLAVKAARVH